jgi:ATP-binding cassette subfamily D (ALD) long-chain fatty acid import protein
MTLKRRLPAVLVAAAVLYVAQKQFRKKASLPRIPSTQSLKDTAKVKLNTRFIRQLRYILRLCIPSWKCRASGLITLHAMFLVLRTYLSVVVARIDGKLVKDLVKNSGIHRLDCWRLSRIYKGTRLLVLRRNSSNFY